MATEKTRGGGKKPPPMLKPGMVVVAIMLLWAARHEPAGFDAASLTGWIFGACTTALLARAAFALALPLLGVLGAVFARALANQQNGMES